MSSVRSFHRFVHGLLAIALTLICFGAVAVRAQSIRPGTGRFGTAKSARALQHEGKLSPSMPAPANPAAVRLIKTEISGPLQITQQLASFQAMTNTESNPQTLRLTNNSSIPYAISLGPLSGANPADFHVDPCSNSILNSKASCDVTVTFEPHGQGPSSAVIQLTAVAVPPAGDAQNSTENQVIPINVSGTASSTCIPTKSALLPLNLGGVTNAQINCFYGTSSNLAFTTQAQYLYNPGSNANTVNADLTSLQFPGGFQLTLAAAAKANSDSGTDTTASSAGAKSPRAIAKPFDNSSSSPTSSSLSQDIQTLTQGGNFAIKGVWPILNLRGKGMQLVSVAAPKLGFDVNGLGQTTPTGATDVNLNLSSETYAQLDAIPAKDDGESPGSVFFDYRGGWEHVSSQFASNSGLNGENSFALQQLSLGFVINGLIRLGAQRYFGPEQAYVNSSGSTATMNNFGKWQLSIQLNPSKANSKN